MFDRRAAVADAVTPKAAKWIDRSKSASGESPRVRLNESVDVYVVGLDTNGCINYCGVHAEQFFKAAGRSALGRPLVDLFDAQTTAALLEAIDSASHGGHPSTIETKYFTREGNNIDISVLLQPSVAPSGAVAGVGVVIRDVTEQRWLSSTLDSTLVALRVALEEARVSEERTRRFLADAAHQLRTPMTGIRASAEMLLGSPQEEHRDQLMTVLIRETERATSLMSSLLAMARLEQTTEVARDVADITRLCEDEVDRALSLAPQLDIAVVATSEVVPIAVDGKMVREMLANLLDNSRRHASSQIRVHLSVNDAHLNIAVSDDGPGVPDEHVDRVFERFVSLDVRGGSGLGLPIARAAARAHGGDLTYTSGAFVVSLPTSAEATSGA